jgi:hypothetical protein
MHLGSAQELAPCRVNKDICTHGPALNLVTAQAEQDDDTHAPQVGLGFSAS